MGPFDELAEALARGVSRRQALKQFAVGATAAIVSTMLPWRPPTIAAAAERMRLYASGVEVSGMSVPGSMLPSIRVGESGPNVEAIQYLLRQSGRDVEVDGDFGGQTDGAVRTFQRLNELFVDGVVGPQTWEALFVPVVLGDLGDAVSAVQTLLNAQGQDVAVDGDFGDQTDGAVKSFQKSNGLTVDGMVGPQTWTALVNN